MKFPKNKQEVIDLLWHQKDWDFVLGDPYDHQVIGVLSIELSKTTLVVIVESVSLFRPEGRKETFHIFSNGDYSVSTEPFPTNQPADYNLRANPYAGWRDKIKLV